MDPCRKVRSGLVNNFIREVSLKEFEEEDQESVGTNPKYLFIPRIAAKKELSPVTYKPKKEEPIDPKKLHRNRTDKTFGSEIDSEADSIRVDVTYFERKIKKDL